MATPPALTELKHLFGGIYEGKNVFVTGHTGFKGSWLCLWLEALGANVTGYALAPNTEPALYPQLGLNAHSHLADIRTPQPLKAAMAQAQPHVVFHLAAQPLVRLSYQQPVETLETNVMGTVHVLEAVRATPSVQAVVVVTSDKCYQNNEWVWGYRETDPMGGHDPYSASKGIAELVVSSYRNSYFSEHAHPSFRHPALLASGRAGNVIGGGDWALDRIIPDAVRAAATGAVLQVRNPVATRPWQHVLEPLSGYLEIGQKLLEGNPAFAQAWNFGPEDASSVSVQKVVGLFQEHWPDLQVAFNAQPAGQLHEAMLLKLDVSKAWHYLKWQPVWGLAQTLAHTTLWYRQYYQQHTNARTLSLQDLTTFAQAAQQMGLGWAS